MLGTNVRYIYREPHIRWFTEWIGVGSLTSTALRLESIQTLYRLLAEMPDVTDDGQCQSQSFCQKQFSLL
jgi:hypothetical protein